MLTAYKEAGVNDETVVKIKAIESSYAVKTKELYAARDSHLNLINGKDAIKKLNEALKKKKEAAAPISPSVPQTAEEKAAMKKKQEEDKVAAPKETGFTDPQIEKYNKIMTDFTEKNGGLTV